jgi:hypothetical protein
MRHVFGETRNRRADGWTSPILQRLDPEEEAYLMSSMLRRLPPLGAMAAIVLVPALAYGNGPQTTTSKAGSTVIGRTTTVVLYPSMTTMLQRGRITLTAVPPSSAVRSVQTFPIHGGHIVATTFTGTISHAGGLTFSHNRKRVTMTNFVINTQTKQLTASVAGRSLPSFNLNLASLRHASEPHRTMIATNIKLTVTSNAARALNDGLGVTTFKAGQYFGVATLVVAFKP